MIVSPASRMLRAISLGVFCRLAPSTRAIMRSRKVSPGFERDAHDDPVGQHPGAAGDRRAVAARLADDRGRLAGDGRLVDRGDALDDLAVAGDDLARPRRRTGRRPAAALDGLLDRRRPALRTRAMVSERVLRRVSAWALPRPSAMASAKLANSTVNHSQSADQGGEAVGVADRRGRW